MRTREYFQSVVENKAEEVKFSGLDIPVRLTHIHEDVVIFEVIEEDDKIYNSLNLTLELFDWYGVNTHRYYFTGGKVIFRTEDPDIAVNILMYLESRTAKIGRVNFRGIKFCIR